VPALRWGIPEVYGIRAEMEKTVREYGEKEQERIQRSTALAEYALKVVAPVFRRSTERIEQVQDLDWSENGNISHDGAIEFHKLSANARLEASKDLGSLFRAPESQAPAAGELRRNVQDLLQAEIAVWESVDDYVTMKAKGQESNKAFDPLLKNLFNYNRFLNAYGPTLQATEKEEIIPTVHASMNDEDDFHRIMAKHREKLILAVGGIVVAISIVISISLYFFWPLIQRKKPQPRIILRKP
jgi:hypothetical protein